MQQIRLYLAENGLGIATKIVITVLIFLIGYWLIKVIVKTVDKMLGDKLDKTLRPFAKSVLSVLLKVLLLISIAATLGVATTSFVALIGAATLAIGMAMQGSLANFAGGIVILIFKPFLVDDYIKAQDTEGTVKEIQFFATVIETLNKETIYIPNGILANGNIINYTQQGMLRLNIALGISYEADIKKARAIIMETVGEHSLVLKQPSADVVVTELADSSVNLMVRPWVKPQHKPAVKAALLEEIKLSLDEHLVEIPYPQTVVHLKQT